MDVSHTQIDSRRGKGNFGEQKVVDWLQKNGYSILRQNYTCRQGEVDIIAQKDEVVAFIEVKTRLKLYFDLSQVITYSKKKKIIATAKNYISRYGDQNKVYRFDVALVEKVDNNFDINYISNAFWGS